MIRRVHTPPRHCVTAVSLFATVGTLGVLTALSPFSGILRLEGGWCQGGGRVKDTSERPTFGRVFLGGGQCTPLGRNIPSDSGNPKMRKGGL
jgi:hypothetical protein